jgi:hypothetical protein
MNKTVWVPSNYAPTYREELYEVKTGERGLLGGDKTRTEKRSVQAGYSDNWIDGPRLQADCQQAIEKLNAEGYEVISMTPVESGRYAHDHKVFYSGNSAAGWGYGFSVTSGIIILARQR